jgi:O-antigen/teichoic acid export membrane protein
MSEGPSSQGGQTHRLVATVRDVGFVSFGKYGQYIVTVVTVPLLARVLGIEGLGLLAIGMSSYFIGSVLVDLNIAQFLSAKMQHENINQLRGNYLAVRASVLVTITVGLLAGLAFDVGVHIQMILLGLFAGGLWSMSEDWVLIGQARFGSSMGYQAIGRVAYLVLVVVLLPRYPHAATAMLCLVASSVLTVGLTWWDAMRRYGLPARPRHVLDTVRIGVPMLASRLLVVSYGQGSATIYSTVLDAASLGLFSAGDRLVRAAQSLLDAIGFALLPRMARIGDEDRFWKRATLALLVCLGSACVACAALWVAAPVLIDLIFGEAFTSAIPLLRVEALILPAATVTSFVTTAVLPVRQDTSGVLIGAVVGTCMAAAWLGAAVLTRSVWALVWGTVSCEVVVALWYVVRMRQLRTREERARRGDVAAVQERATSGGTP